MGGRTFHRQAEVAAAHRFCRRFFTGLRCSGCCFFGKTFFGLSCRGVTRCAVAAVAAIAVPAAALAWGAGCAGVGFTFAGHFCKRFGERVQRLFGLRVGNGRTHVGVFSSGLAASVVVAGTALAALCFSRFRCIG